MEERGAISSWNASEAETGPILWKDMLVVINNIAQIKKDGKR